jgi:hypothetical protein
MISNITNVLPLLLKRLKERDDTIKLDFDLIEMLNFYESILPRTKTLCGLRHIYLDCVFKIKPELIESLDTLILGIETLPFVKDFDYILDKDNHMVVIRSNMEELSVFSLIMLGAIKNLPTESKNPGILVSLVFNYLKFCVQSGYNICKSEDLKLLETYNGGFDQNVCEAIMFAPTSEKYVATMHFVGIELNKDIMKIFEKYKDVKFTYNEENASFIVSMRSADWDDFWKDAPQYLKDEFSNDSRKTDIS